ncbi:MAG: hypothetical protein U0X76_04045 [Bacteroidia bacterium]
MLWTKTYGGTQSDWALSMTLAANGDYYIFGNSKSSDHDVTANHGDWDLDAVLAQITVRSPDTVIMTSAKWNA